MGARSHFVARIEPPVRMSPHAKSLFVLHTSIKAFEQFDPTNSNHLGKEFHVKCKDGSYTVAYPGQKPPITSPKGSPNMAITGQKD